jgi:hypothetical protein
MTQSPGKATAIRYAAFLFLLLVQTMVLYTQNAIGTFGNAGHFSLRTPSYFDMDASISRKFNLGERFQTEARVEAFNLTNHPNFGGPTPSTGVGLGENANASSSAFGRITTAGDPRILQGAIKLTF